LSQEKGKLCLGCNRDGYCRGCFRGRGWSGVIIVFPDRRSSSLYLRRQGFKRTQKLK